MEEREGWSKSKMIENNYEKDVVFSDLPPPDLHLLSSILLNQWVAINQAKHMI